MKERIRWVGAIAGVIALALVSAACGGNSTATSSPTTGTQWTTSHPFTAAFIYVGAPSDAGWTHAHEVGRLAVESNFGGRVKTIYKENVPEGPQSSQVITQLVNQGANIIFATSFGYQDSMAAAAKQYPNVLFEQATGTDMATNLSEYFGAGEDGDFLSGMAAGSATKNGKIGFVAPYPIPEVIREIDAFTMGARLMNPNATVQVVWTNTWFDPAKERQAAESLVAAGVDTLGDGQDSPTTGQVAAAAGLKWTGYDSDQTSFAPDAWLTATTYNWGPYYIKTVQDAMNGSWKSHFYYGGLADGLVVMAPFGKSVSADAQAKIMAKQADIKSGAFKVFGGPIMKQDGTVGVAAGSSLTVDQLYAVNWFVQGVKGTIPSS
ncbi:MAG TPA: BMP family ABC transporter substrate-binding protein [Candidatus Sulfotelmatobacter sp.]|nr:BMP family ABC transporter substrate-binding protein [Candidatus Sulfotelmatobacter sp.]